jgi:hypothetical protein
LVKEIENKDIDVSYVERIMAEMLIEKLIINNYMMIFVLKIEHINS